MTKALKFRRLNSAEGFASSPAGKISRSSNSMKTAHLEDMFLEYSRDVQSRTLNVRALVVRTGLLDVRLLLLLLLLLLKEVGNARLRESD